MVNDRLNCIKKSALWAAYGDALGFITELVDETGLKRRVNKKFVEKPVSWKRKIGGYYGVNVELPAGCYSDDTQLRLATSRAIQGDGEFDVEAFAKIELPVWTSYALGAGRGSKAAASSFARQDTNWFSNFFKKNRIDYVLCGGNGAAMRVQPHVWVASEPNRPETYICDVVKNAICTHGHMRGILGAVFHALCLGGAIESGVVPSPGEWEQHINFFPKVEEIIREDNDINAFWLPVWEERSNSSFLEASKKVQEECSRDIDSIVDFSFMKDPGEGYKSIVKKIGGFEDASRGSGTKTSIIAASLCWLFRKDSPVNAITTAANLLNSDTDTIGTMAGAILGVVTKESPPDLIIDSDYIQQEAERLYRISCKEETESFVYPDLFGWKPPKTQLDVVGLMGDVMAVSGLSEAKEIGEPYYNNDKNQAAWQWLELDFGQKILIKRRPQLRQLLNENYPQRDVIFKPKVKKKESGKLFSEVKPQEKNSHKKDYSPKSLQETKPVVRPQEKSSRKKGFAPKSLHEMTNVAIKSGFDEKLIGRHILEFSRQSGGIEKAIAYTSIIAKAIISRYKNGS